MEELGVAAVQEEDVEGVGLEDQWCCWGDGGHGYSFCCGRLEWSGMVFGVTRPFSREGITERERERTEMIPFREPELARIYTPEHPFTVSMATKRLTVTTSTLSRPDNLALGRG